LKPFPSIFAKFAAAHPERFGTVAGWLHQVSALRLGIFPNPVDTKFLDTAQVGVGFAYQGLVGIIALLDLGFVFSISWQATHGFGAKITTVVQHGVLEHSPEWAGIPGFLSSCGLFIAGWRARPC
jgi:hypothetical protein